MLTYQGMRVIESPLCDNWPRMQLTPSFAALMPAAWAEETNQWMREFFGTESKAYVIGGDTLVLGPKAIAMLRRQL